MMKSEYHRAERLAATQGQAVAFAEDMHHLRRVLSDTDSGRGEIRRLSGVLRRVLVDGELESVAGPRIGRMLLTSPQNKAVYRDAKDLDIDGIWVSGGARLFGVVFRNIGSLQLNAESDPSLTTLLKLRDFLNQRVIYFGRNWIQRKSVITYVANKGSAIHTGKITEPEHQLLKEFQKKLYLGKRGDRPAVAMNFSGNDILDVDASKLNLTTDAIDGISLELLSAAAYLVDSPDVMKLEQMIIEENDLKL